jgi:hypothetical protein
MQAAIGITVADRVASWIDPLTRHLLRLETFSQNGFALQFGGAAGMLEKLGDNACAVHTWGNVRGTRRYRLSTMPPSTRSAAPVVAEAWREQT